MKRTTNFVALILVLVMGAGAGFAQGTGGGSGNRIRAGGGQVAVNPDGSIDVTNTANTATILNRALGWRCLVVQPPVSPPGQARVYNDCATQLLRISTNGGAYVTLGGTGAAGSGTVTSIGMSSLVPLFTVSPSAITTNGTFTFALNSQAAGTFFAAPAGASGAPLFRGIVASDVPALDVSKVSTGVFNITRGGTGLSSYTFGDTLFANGAGALSTLAGNSSSTKKFLSQAGNGTFSGVPAWSVLAASDLPPVNLSTLNGNGGIMGALGTANGGTGLSTIGNANTLLGVNNLGNGYEFKTPIAGNNLSITHTAGGIRFDVNSVISSTTTAPDGSAAAPAYSFTNETNSGLYRAGAGDHRYSILGNDALGISASALQYFGGRFNVYGSFTDAANFTRGALTASANAVTLAAESAGTGSPDMNVLLSPRGNGVVGIGGNGYIYGNHFHTNDESLRLFSKTIQFSAANQQNIEQLANGEMRFFSGSTGKINLYFANSGNVGINTTTNISSTLTVAGTSTSDGLRVDGVGKISSEFFNANGMSGGNAANFHIDGRTDNGANGNIVLNYFSSGNVSSYRPLYVGGLDNPAPYTLFVNGSMNASSVAVGSTTVIDTNRNIAGVGGTFSDTLTVPAGGSPLNLSIAFGGIQNTGFYVPAGSADGVTFALDGNAHSIFNGSGFTLTTGKYFGDGSSLSNVNAAKLGGQTSSVTAQPNTIVARDAAGSIAAATFNGSSINNGVINGVTLNNSVTATRLTSTIATGTAPLTVASTTVVPNLNSALLNGQTATSANTANTIVARDNAGNFAAAGITVGDLSSGNVGSHIKQAAANSDIAGVVTIGAGNNQANHPFATAYTSAPVCVISLKDAFYSPPSYFVTTTTTAVTVALNNSATASANMPFNYICIGNPY